MIERRRFIARAGAVVPAADTAAVIDAPNFIAHPGAAPGSRDGPADGRMIQEEDRPDR